MPFYFHPDYFHPATAAYVGLGFEQIVGGKELLTFQNVPGLRADTGTRDNITSLSLVAGSIVSPTIFADVQLQQDVRVRGGEKSTTLVFHVAKIF